MCLRTYELEPKTLKKPKRVWKILKVHENGTLMSIYYYKPWIQGKRSFVQEFKPSRVGVELKCGICRNYVVYEKGFHSYVTEETAKKELKRLRKYTLIPNKLVLAEFEIPANTKYVSSFNRKTICSKAIRFISAYE